MGLRDDVKIETREIGTGFRAVFRDADGREYAEVNPLVSCSASSPYVAEVFLWGRYRNQVDCYFVRADGSTGRYGPHLGPCLDAAMEAGLVFPAVEAALRRVTR